ncbi:hypothetical protein BH09ACT10_BH09ACT10_22560 [soil metagenome]
MTSENQATSLSDLLLLQQSVLSSTQAVTYLSRDKLRRLVASGRWSRPTRGVYVAHNGPLTREQRDWVALFACAPGSILAGLSALSYDGLKGFEPDPPVVVQPMGAKPTSYADAETHWSIYLDERDVHPLHSPPRTRIARSLIDAASWSLYPRRARVLIIAGMQQGLVSTRQLREALERRGACKHRRLIVESILDAKGGIQSLPERDFDLLCRRAGLPKPSRQRIVRGKDGRFYLDAAWDEFDTTVEIHGIPHMWISNWDGDLLRANEISIAAGRLLIFSSYAVRHCEDQVIDQLVRMLKRGGYVPTNKKIYF